MYVLKQSKPVFPNQQYLRVNEAPGSFRFCSIKAIKRKTNTLQYNSHRI